MSDEIFFNGIQFISAGEAGELADLSRDYVARLCKEGRLLAKRVGKHWYVSKDSLHDFALKQEYTRATQREELARTRREEYNAETGEVSSFKIIPRIAPQLRSALASLAQAPIATPATRALSSLPLHAASLGKQVGAHALPPVADALHKLLAIATALLFTVGTYLFVDAQYARLTSQAGVAERASLYASALIDAAGEQLALSAEDPIGAFSSMFDTLARTVNRRVDGLVYRVMFPPSLTGFSPERESVSVRVTSTRQSGESSGRSRVVDASTASNRGAGANTTTTTVVNHPIIERVVETQRIVASAGGLTEEILNKKLTELDEKLSSRIYAVASVGSANSTTIVEHYNAVGGALRIDELDKIALKDSTITGGSIAGTSASLTSLSVTGTGTSTFSGGIQARAFSASSQSSLSTTTINGALTVTGDTTLNGTLSIPGALTISSSTVSLLTNTYATTSFISAVTASTTNLTWVSATGTNTILTNATTTKLFASSATLNFASSTALTVFGTGYFGGTATSTFTSAGRLGILTAFPTYPLEVTGVGRFSSTVDAANFVATSSSATSTFAGGLLATRAPAAPHTFSSWSIGAANAFPFDASLVVNPASAAGDGNLISASVGGSVKFLVDAEGDVFVNNLTSVGSVTLSTTSASTFTVENNTTLGDAITDVTTINGTLTVAGTTTVASVAGKFGVGTTTPWAKLSVHANNGETNTSLFTIASSTASATTTLFNISNTGAITSVGSITSTATGANTFPYASSTALSVSGTGYFGSASTTNLTVSGIQNSILSTNATGVTQAATIGNGLTFSSNTLSTSFGTTSANTWTALQTFQSGLISQASSTFTGTTFLNGGATTTQLTNTGNTYLTALTSALLGTDSTGKVVATSSIGANLLSGTITNSQLANSSVTINSAGLLSGGGSVSLGGSLNLNASTSPTVGYVFATSSTASTLPYASSTALTVSGHCVAADTRLRRRRRRADGTYEEEDVMIKDIEEGDEVMTLDQKTGEFTWSRVNGLVDTGIQPLITITTQSGRQIRTTYVHPYLARIGEYRKKVVHAAQKSYRFEVDLSVKIEDYSADSIVAIANQEQSFTVEVPRKVKQALRDLTRRLRKPKRLLPAVFAYAIVEALARMQARVHELVIDTDYLMYDDLITSIIRSSFPSIHISFWQVGKHSPAHLAAYKVHRNKKVADATATIEMLASKTENALRATFSSNLSAEPPVGPQALSDKDTIHGQDEFVKKGKWTKAAELRVGQEIAVAYGNTPAWERVVKIEEQQAETVYDVEIEGTHNFVANGIVAHNTYLGTASATGAFTSTANTANTLPYASSTALTVSGNAYLTALTSALLGTDSTGKVVATSSIGANLIGGTLTDSQISSASVWNAKLSSSSLQTSALLAGLLSDETGTGNVVFSASPTLTGTANLSSLIALASSTIGAGGQTTGLTISGGATTTGNAYFAGNIGIGTTSPATTVAISGHCVTGDTRLRRRRRRADGSYEYDEPEIVDLEEGDEIQSLDEKTGEMVWSRVKKVMFMGVRQTYRITTEDGRMIRTTAEHPYLVKNAKGKWLKHRSAMRNSELSARNSDWVTVANLKEGDEIVVTGMVLKGGVSSDFGLAALASGKRSGRHPETVAWSTSPMVAQNEKAALADGFSTPHPGSSSLNGTSYVRIVSPAIWLSSEVLHNGDNALLQPVEGLEPSEHGIRSPVQHHTTGLQPSYHELQMKNVLAWTKIRSIEPVAEEEVFDVEIEGTHNFVANGIVAHNTYLTGGLGVGVLETTNGKLTTSWASSTALTASGTGYFGSASTTNLTVSGIQNSILSTNATGVTQAATIGNGLTFSSNTLSTSFGTTTANIWTALQTFQSGLISQASSTFTGFTQLANASTTQLTNSGTTWLTSLSSAVLGVDTTGKLVATSSIGANLIGGTLADSQISSASVWHAKLSSSSLQTSSLLAGLLSDETGTGNVVFSASPTLTGTANLSSLIALASSTIGSGAQAGGLTISGGATTTGNAYFAGNVGIGTTSPYLPLSVVGKGIFTGGVLELANTADAGSRGFDLINSAGTLNFSMDSTRTFIVNDATAGLGRLYMDSSGHFGLGNYYAPTNVPKNNLSVAGAASIGFGISGDATAPSNGMIVNGNVGVGTTSPATTLSISGNTYTTGGEGIGVLNTTAGTLQTSGLITGGSTLTLNGTSGTTTLASGQGFTIGGSQFVLQQGSGNVGIGANAPSYPLDINGNFRTSGIFYNTRGSASWNQYGSGTSYFFNDGSADRITFTNTGNVGIGTTSPGTSGWTAGKTLTVYGGAAGSPGLLELSSDNTSNQSAVGRLAFTQTVFGTTQAASLYGYRDVNNGTLGLRFNAGGTDRLTISSGGNLGIGTTSPSTLLSLAGTTGIYASTTATSTFQGGGINLTTAAGNTGCFAIDGTCLPTLLLVNSNIASAYPFQLTGNATSTLTQFNGGLTAYASSTIGAGGQATGLTIFGGATTTGVLTLSNGSSGAPSINLGDPLTGFYRNAAQQWTFVSNGNAFSIFNNGGTAFQRWGSNGLVAWTGSDSTASADTGVSRISAGVLGIGTGALNSTAGTILSANASTTLLSVTNKAYFGGTATSTFNSAGQLGVLTSSPSYPLDVAGFINTDQYSGYKQAGNTILYASTTNNALAVGASSAAGWMSASSTAWYSIAIGQGALATTPTNGAAQHNIALGGSTLASNTTGSRNIAIGYQNLSVNTTGGSNTAIGGYRAMVSNTTGGQNTAIGNQSFSQNTTGDYNTGLGYNSGFFNSTGGYNVAIGPNTLFTATSSSNHVAIGYSALTNMITGGSNDTEGNVALGYKAGTALTYGGANILLGYQAGDALTTGSNNIAIGYDIDLPSNTASNQLTIGNLIFGTGIDGTGTTVSTGKIGIGTTTPVAKLEVANGTQSVQIDSDDIRYRHGGDPASTYRYWLMANTIGIGPGSGNESGLLFNSSDGGNVRAGLATSLGGLAFYTNGTTNTNAAQRMIITSAGNVGIGTTTPNWTLTSSNSTGPQLSLGDGTNNSWTFRNSGATLYLATSTYSATSTVAALTFNNTTGAATFGSPATTTFSGGVQTTALNITSTSATSTGANGWNLTAGCFSVNGTCLGTGSGGGTPGGSDSQVQFNNNGSFAGGANFTFSSSTNLLKVTNASSTLLSLFDRLYVGGTATTTIRGDGFASTLPYASSTALSISGTGYFGTASTTNLTVSGIQSSLLSTNATGVTQAATIGNGLTFSSNTLSTSFGTTTANTWTALQTFQSGLISQASSTFTGFTQLAQASTTMLTNTGNTYLTALTSALLGTDSTGKVVATSSIGANLLSGTITNAQLANSSVTVNSAGLLSGGGSVSLGGTLTLNASTSPTVGYVFATSSIASTLPYASSTALTVSGTGYLGLLAATQTSGTSTIAAGQGFTIGSSQFVLQQGSGNVGIGTTTPQAKLEIVNTSSGATADQLYLSNLASATSTASRLSFRTQDIINNTGTTTAALISILQQNFNTGKGDLAFSTLQSGTLTEVMRITSAGYLGVGTTTPFRKLSVTDTVSNAQFALAYDATRATQLQTDASGDLVIDPSGNDAFLNDDNFWVCTGGSCPSGNPSGTGNLIVENRIGIGTSTPASKFVIETQDATTNFLQIASSTNQNIFIINAAGKVGIGSSTPTTLLSIGGLLSVGASTTGEIATLGTATSTFNGDVKIRGKLDVGTIDPVYTIDGTKYATYGHSTVGVKEEATVKIAVREWDASRKLFKYAIDFSALEEGSDLWLFYQISDFGKDWENLIVTLTPAFNGRTFYEEDVVRNTLTIWSDAAGAVSARFIANRYDAARWPNLRLDQDDANYRGHVIQGKP